MNSVLSPAAVVRAFYGALDARNPEAVGDLVDQAFAPEAAVDLPPSLPYGGRVEGAGRLRRMFTAMASGRVPVGPEAIRIVSVVDNGDQVAAALEFGWRAPGTGEVIPSSALELWTFAGGRVSEIRAYYWDTAALVGERQAAGS